MLEEASSKPLTTVARDVLRCRDKLADLDKVAQSDASLKEELKVVIDLFVGLNWSIGPKQSILAATFLTRRLRASQTTDSAESVKKAMVELKYSSQIVRRHGHQLLAQWHLPATGSTPPWDAAHLQPAGPGVPRSASRFFCSVRFPTTAGTQILHRDPGQSSGHYTPPARGRGRRKDVLTAKAAEDAQPAAAVVKLYVPHASQQVNPPTTATPTAQRCYRCGQPGHIQQFYPN